jgi:predicted nucleic acid-binding protein
LVVSVYLDANVLIALFIPDTLSARAIAAVGALSDPIILSDIGALEVVSSIARLARSRELTQRTANEALSDFDAWADSHSRIEIQTSDVAVALGFVRRFDINLHGADALHVAMAARAGAALLTFDAKMRANAKKVGLAVV